MDRKYVRDDSMSIPLEITIRQKARLEQQINAIFYSS